MLRLLKRDRYVRAKRPGRVDAVATGTVVVNGDAYENMKATLVQPGQNVVKGQPLGKRK